MCAIIDTIIQYYRTSSKNSVLLIIRYPLLNDWKYRISSKSCHGEILFQGSVWCGDNSRAARFQGRRLQRSTRTCIHNFNNKRICMHVKCACAYWYSCRPFTIQRDFEGGVYWDELVDRCGDIPRAAGFRGTARFRGNTVVSNNLAKVVTCICYNIWEYIECAHRWNVEY